MIVSSQVVIIFYHTKELQQKMKELLRKEAELAADNKDVDTQDLQQGSCILLH